jgi:hypothetical protein
MTYSAARRPQPDEIISLAHHVVFSLPDRAQQHFSANQQDNGC